MRRLGGTVLLGFSVCLLTCVGCWEQGERGVDDEPELVVFLDWEEQGDLPGLGIAGKLVTPGLDAARAAGTTVAGEKEIEGEKYVGVLCYRDDPGAAQEPEALLMAAYARRLRKPVEVIDIRVSSKVAFMVEVDNFENGVIRYADTKTVLPDWPSLYTFGPGDYHLEAVMNPPFPRSMALGEKKIPLALTINWDARKDVRENQPACTCTGELMTHVSGEPYVPTVVGSDEKEIGGLTYEGTVVCDGPGAEQLKPEARVLHLLMRRLHDPEPMIDIHLSCKVQCVLRFEDFKGGVLRRADNKEKVARPYLFDPGTYHLQAVMPEEPDGE